MSMTGLTKPTGIIPLGASVAAALVVVELLLLSILYKHNFEFTCNAHAPHELCQLAGRIVPRALGVIAGLTLFAVARRGALRVFSGRASLGSNGLLLNLFGFALIVAPWLYISDASSQAAMLSAAGFWSLGLGLAVAGLLQLVAPWSVWRGFFAEHGIVLGIVIAAGILLPEFADQFGLIWQLGWITDVTFQAVHLALMSLGYDAYAIPETKVIGNSFFAVEVGAPCSGVEGFALITAFLGIYFSLFRRELRFPHAFLLIPIGILASWCFNVVRITVLIAIGFAGSPELAIGGFHSHAGWLAFTMLAIALILVSRSVPFFQAEPRAAQKTSLPPFFADPMVAQIFPFAVFMGSALLASTFSETPSLLYPLRALITGAALWIVWPYLRQLPWRIDPLALGSGLVIGALWIVTGPAASGEPPFGALTGGLFALWIATRLIGTSLFVPILEEIMFRGYIQSRIAADGASALRLAIGVGVATLLFALLHDRWLAAALAGLVFSALVIRSRNITDAILSHGVANLTIALWALATGAWHIL